MPVHKVLHGWAKSIKELVHGVFWVATHPLKFVLDVFYLVVDSITVIRKPGNIINFLAASPREPYKAMTVLAVYGAILAGVAYAKNDWVLMGVGAITMNASSIAYLIQRSIDFARGNHHSADGIDGLILVTEMVPVFGGLAVATRLFGMESIVMNVESSFTKATAATGRLSRVGAAQVMGTGRLTQGFVPPNVEGAMDAANEFSGATQPVMNVVEWTDYWIGIKNDFLKKALKLFKHIKK